MMGGMGMLAAARPAGAAGEKRTGFYVLETFYLQQGAQVPRMHDYFSRLALPALQRVHYTGPVIFLESLVAPHMPQMIAPPEPPKTPRLFELRVYHSPTWRQLKALHERFAGPEIQIFHRVGVNPVLYSSTLFGANMPNLTYLIPFENLAAREKAWEAFAADPEWIKVRKESIEKHGQMSSIIQISLFKATAYSPV